MAETVGEEKGRENCRNGSSKSNRQQSLIVLLFCFSKKGVSGGKVLETSGSPSLIHECV